MDYSKLSINERVKHLRETLTLQQKELAEILKVRQSNLSDLENGRRSVSNKTIEKLIRSLGVSRDWLLTGKGVMLDSQNMGNDSAEAHFKYRLAKLISWSGKSLDGFASYIGVPSSVIDRLISNKSTITESTLQKIIEKIPNLNLTWLLSGEGDMLIGESDYLQKQLEAKLRMLQLGQERGIGIESLQTLMSDESILKLMSSGKASSALRHQHLAKSGAFKYVFKFRQNLKKEHPELDKVFRDFIEIDEARELIASLVDSSIGDNVYFLDNIRLAKSYNDFREMSVSNLTSCTPYAEMIHSFAECCRAFKSQLKAIKDEINLDYDFED